MKLFGALFAAVFLQIACGSEDHYEVPEPLFEVFSPKGLRISIPDAKDIRSVEFTVSFPDCPQPLYQEVNRTDGGHWVYWNPEIPVRLYEKLRYKLMVQRNGLYWKREGTHVVEKVQPLTNDTDCTENQGQKIISGFSSLGGLEEANREMFKSGKASSLKSSYSTQKNSELKPITKSSMSTTSGTFFIKPSGVMEATGYKKGSSFDSTRREGEQWEHYQSELTAEELENMKNLYGSGFQDFHHFQSSLFPTSGKIYEKSYMTSESKTYPATLHTIRYGESQPLTTHKFYETHKTHETSSYSHSKPVFQFTDSSRGSGDESNSKSEKLYRMESFGGLPNPLPPQGTIFKATEYVRQEHTVPVAEVSEVRETHTATAPQKFVQVSQRGEFSSQNQETHTAPAPQKLVQVSQREFSTHNQESHTAPAPQKIVQVSQRGEFSSHNQEVVKPQYVPIPVASGSRRADQLEYTSGNLQTVERQDFKARHYMGNIFTTVKTSKVRSPQECSLVPGVDYTSSGSLRELEKYVYELSCLATLAESTMKEEMALLKQKNGDLKRQLELLEQEVKRISDTCNCYE